jgi:hypothetical protein
MLGSMAESIQTAEALSDAAIALAKKAADATHQVQAIQFAYAAAALACAAQGVAFAGSYSAG